jgi:hypothetical protein
MPIDPQRMAAILQRIQPANQGGAPMPPPDMAPMGGPPMGDPMGAPQGVPMQINGTMTPQPMGGPQGMPMRPMMPPGGMQPR